MSYHQLRIKLKNKTLHSDRHLLVLHRIKKKTLSISPFGDIERENLTVNKTTVYKRIPTVACAQTFL